MGRLRTAMAISAVLAVVAATAQGAPALGASPNASVKAQNSSSPTPSKAQSIRAEQSRAVSAGRALGIGGGEKLVVKDVIRDADGSTHVRYNRTFDGLRVIGGDLVSHRDKSGTIKSVSWNAAHKVGVASTAPKVSLASARATGAKKASSVQRTTTVTKGELVVYAGSSPKATPKLAYDVLATGLRAGQTPSRLHTIVDANTGATLLSFDEVENSTGTGHSIFVGTVPLGTTAGPPFSMRDAVGNYTTDLNGATTGTGTTFTDVDNVWGNGAVSDRASAAVDAHYGAGETFDYYQNVLGRDGIWDTGVGARSRVHYGNAYENAFWDGTQMSYGDGAGNVNPLVELDVAGHEMSHGVTENTAGLIYVGEAGGLNEATSDIFGTAVEWYANNAADVPDYLIGEKIDLNGDGTPLRYMDRPSRDGASADCWSPSLGGLDPHNSSGPLNHWFYLASEGSGAKVINGVPYNSPTCNASTVTAVGRAAAEKIWYRTLSVYLTSSNTYAAAREGAVESAKDLYGATSTQCTRVAAAFSAIAVPVGGVTCTATTPLPAGSNLLRNPGFESGETLWSAEAGLIGQWGGSGQPTHSGTWDAWLMGFGSTHSQSISQLVTIPSGRQATLSYYVHIDTAETGPTAFDVMKVSAGSTVLQSLSNVNAAPGYQHKTVNLSPYAGRTISLSFAGTEDSSQQTSFVLDDLSVTTTLTGFTGTTPTRVLDTRTGVGAPAAKLGAGATLTLTVPGLPAGVTAVALNVTATGPSAASFLTVYPGGTTRPTASNLNFVAGQTIPNMVLVPLGAGGKVTFYNNTGTVNVIADLVGYFS